MNINRLKELLQTMVDHGIDGMPDQTIISWTTASIEYIESLEAENAKLKQDINKIKADAILSILNQDYSCETPTGGNAWSDNAIMEYADKIEKEG